MTPVYNHVGYNFVDNTLIRSMHIMAYRTHPIVNMLYTLCNFQDNVKLVCHCTVRYRMEWIFTQMKMNVQSSLDLNLM